MRAVSFPALDVHREVWSEHLRDVFRTLEIPPGTLADNLVASISMYCREFHPHGLRSSDLKLLIARAFCTVGDRAAAVQVLESMEPHRRHVARWLEILSELRQFPLLLPYFSRGVIRPADWAGAQLDRMWTLDFDQLTLTEAERHEMMLYGSIRALVENMFVFWDATEGEGILGLKGLPALNIEKESRRKKTSAATDGLLEFIADLFLQEKDARGWCAVPTLMKVE